MFLPHEAREGVSDSHGWTSFIQRGDYAREVRSFLKLPRGKLSLITQRSILDPWKVIGVTRDSMSWCLGLDQVAEVFETEDSSNRLLIKYRKTLLLVSGPSLADPLDYSLRLLAEEEEFALSACWYTAAPQPSSQLSTSIKR